jgi:hypothetical protein
MLNIGRSHAPLAGSGFFEAGERFPLCVQNWTHRNPSEKIRREGVDFGANCCQIAEKGGTVRRASPEKYAKALTVRVSEEEYRKLKELAERERRTTKALLLIALDTAFPDWRKQ